MITRSTLLHLRIPFSIFLMPVFCFAASQSTGWDWQRYFFIWIILHVFVYPASNGFNSFYDKDEESIGGLKAPPQVKQDLLWTSLLFDLIGLIGAWLIQVEFAVLVFVYGMMSKIYSHPVVRLKKYAILGWLTVGIFQGACTYLMCVMAFENIGFSIFEETSHLVAASCISLLLLGSYPMTQIYQHREDSKRGDRTLSLMLGIKGTFVFTGLFFLIANGAFYYYFDTYQDVFYFWLLQGFMLPVLLYFAYWAFISFKDLKNANFSRTMLLNILSSISMIAYFTVLTFLLK